MLRLLGGDGGALFNCDNACGSCYFYISQTLHVCHICLQAYITIPVPWSVWICWVGLIVLGCQWLSMPIVFDGSGKARAVF